MTDAVAKGLLAGRTAFVTGGARGIGLAVARAFLDQGASVMLADVRADDLDRAREALGSDRVGAIVLDVRDEAATDAAAAETISRFGRIDIIVPNAGVLVLKHAVDTTLDEWRRVIDVNLTGAFLTAKVLARPLIARGGGGRIIFTSSLFGLRGGVENSAYSASKFGMVGLMQCMAAELAPHNIQVNCVCPGQMDTDMIRQLFADRGKLKGISGDEVRSQLESRIPLKHLGTMDELSGTYVWLASDLSRYVTGQSIVVDGGWQIG